MREGEAKGTDTAAYEAWLQTQIQRGLAQTEADQLIPDAEVKKQFAARRAATRRKIDRRRSREAFLYANLGFYSHFINNQARKPA